jgi:hypothetical protein
MKNWGFHLRSEVMRSDWAKLQKFSGIQDAFRIERMFDCEMQVARFLGNGQWPPAFLGDADAVFASDRTTPRQYLSEQFVQGGLGTSFSAGLGVIHHDVSMDVAVAGVAEAGELQLAFLLQSRGEVEQVLQPAARDDDVLVQLGEAGVAQGIGELAADFPDGFALFIAQASFGEQWFLRTDNSLKGEDFVLN